MDIPTIMTLVTVAMSLATFFIGRTTVKHDEGATSGRLKADLEYVKKGIDDIRDRQREQEAKEESWRMEVAVRLSKVEASAKSAHKRLDELGWKGEGRPGE